MKIYLRLGKKIIFQFGIWLRKITYIRDYSLIIADWSFSLKLRQLNNHAYFFDSLRKITELYCVWNDAKAELDDCVFTTSRIQCFYHLLNKVFLPPLEYSIFTATYNFRNIVFNRIWIKVFLPSILNIMFLPPLVYCIFTASLILCFYHQWNIMFYYL